MDIDQVKRIIRKRKGILSDEQHAMLQKMLKSDDATMADGFNITEYAQKVMLGSASEGTTLPDTDGPDHGDECDSPATDEKPVELLQQALQILKVRLDD